MKCIEIESEPKIAPDEGQGNRIGTVALVADLYDFKLTQ